MIIPLEASASVKADAGGAAVVRIYAPGIVRSWNVTRMVTSVTGAGALPTTPINLVVYKNSVSENNRKDSTSSAAQDTSEIPGKGISLQSTDFLIGIYTGAPVGSDCTLSVTGETDTGR